MSLVQTLMQPLRAEYKADTLDKNEIRPSMYGAWDFFQKQSKLAGGLFTDQVKKFIDESAGQNVDIPVLNAPDVTISNVRSCTIAADTETSALVRLTFVTYQFGFTMVPSRFKNNDIGYQQLFNQKLKAYLLKLADTLDTAAVNTLNINRNTYFPAAITKYYANVANALQVPLEARDDFFNQLEAIFREMDYYEMINIIGSTSLLPIINRLKAQGAGNMINQSFQFNPYRWHTTNRLLNGAGVGATVFGVPDGYVATRNRNMPDNIAGSIIGPEDAPMNQWGLAQMPIVNLEMGTYYTRSCADNSTLDGGGARMTQLQRSLTEGFSWDTDVCFLTSYNSSPTTKYNPILKAEISNVPAPVTP